LCAAAFLLALFRCLLRCSYGFISNLNYGTALGVAWLAFVKKYGVAPTAPGQWKVFLAFYAGACVHALLVICIEAFGICSPISVSMLLLLVLLQAY
jgi:hypothetical protein